MEFEFENDFQDLAPPVARQREQNSRHNSHNGLRFFAGYAAAKRPRFARFKAAQTETVRLHCSALSA
jgi:hypothetical protein